MAATRDRYRIPQISERWFVPYTSCTILSTLSGAIATTLGEMVTWPSGTAYGQAALKQLVRKAWKAIDPDRSRSGYGRQHLNAMFDAWNIPLSLSEVKFTREREDIINALKGNNVVVMAGNTRGCRAQSPLRDHVNEVDHRMAFKDFRYKNGQAQTRVYDPMAPYGNRHWGRWVPVQDMFDFGKRFRHWGRFFAEKYRSGHYTREAKARRAGAKAVLQVQEQVVNLQAALRTAGDEYRRVVEERDQLQYMLDNQPDRAELLLQTEMAYQSTLSAVDDINEIRNLLTVMPVRTE